MIISWDIDLVFTLEMVIRFKITVSILDISILNLMIKKSISIVYKNYTKLIASGTLFRILFEMFGIVDVMIVSSDFSELFTSPSPLMIVASSSS